MYQFPEQESGRKSRFIEMSPRDLHDAVRLLKLLLESAPPAEQTRKIPSPANKDKMIELASKIFYSRKRRSHFFNPDMFGESGWDFLLFLYMMDERGPRLTVGRLREFVGVPSASTARWLSSLESQQLIVRESHRTDARSSTVRLTDKGREMMEMYLSETVSERS
jgi:DNA-binding MarR family transcriptional regulator